MLEFFFTLTSVNGDRDECGMQADSFGREVLASGPSNERILTPGNDPLDCGEREDSGVPGSERFLTIKPASSTLVEY